MSSAPELPHASATVPSGTNDTGESAAAAADQQLLAAIKALEEKDATGKGSPGGVLLVTGLLFVAAGGWSWGWRAVGMLAAAIAIHELGHVMAMKNFNYKNVRLLFVPFFGGLATGKPTHLDALRNAQVALAGPVFGLLSGVLVAATGWLLGRPAWVGEFAWITLGLNAFNLLPLMPLDGGQAMNDTLFSRFPALEAGFRLVGAIALGWYAWEIKAWPLAIPAGFLLLTLGFQYQRACVLRSARRDPAWQNRVLDRETAGMLRALVQRMFTRMNLKQSQLERSLPSHALGLWLEVQKRFPGPGKTIALVSAYLGVSFVVVPAIGWFIAASYGIPANG